MKPRNHLGFLEPLNRLAVGTLFTFSGNQRKLNAQCLRMLIDKLKALQIHALGISRWWVPLVEFSAGGAAVIRLFGPPSALGRTLWRPL